MKLPVELTIDAICAQYIRERERVLRDPFADDDSQRESCGSSQLVSRFDEGIEVHES